MSALVVNAKTFAIDWDFDSYVRPIRYVKENTKETILLSNFCIHLTKITQDNVNQARELKDVITAFDQWLTAIGLRANGVRFAVVTHKDSNLYFVLAYSWPPSLAANGVSDRDYFRRWINVQKSYEELTRKSADTDDPLVTMVEGLGLTLQTPRHRGPSVCDNIAQIMKKLSATYNCTFSCNRP